MLTIQHTNNTHTVEQQWEFYSALTLIIDIQGRPTVCTPRAGAAHRGSATSEGPVGAISVRSAGSIKLPSAVVLSCQGGSRRAIGERVIFSSLLCALVRSFIVGFRIEIRAYFHRLRY